MPYCGQGKCGKSRVTVLGNDALTGAAVLLLCDEHRPVCEKMAKGTKIVELATNPVFVSE